MPPVLERAGTPTRTPSTLQWGRRTSSASDLFQPQPVPGHFIVQSSPFLLLFFQEIIRPDVPWSPARAHGGHCQCYLVHVPTSQPCQHQLRFGVQMQQCLQGVCQR